MTEKKGNQSKLEKKLAPPRTIDPKLSQKVELGEQMPDKKVVIFEIER